MSKLKIPGDLKAVSTEFRRKVKELGMHFEDDIYDGDAECGDYDFVGIENVTIAAATELIQGVQHVCSGTRVRSRFSLMILDAPKEKREQVADPFYRHLGSENVLVEDHKDEPFLDVFIEDPLQPDLACLILSDLLPVLGGEPLIGINTYLSKREWVKKYRRG